MHTCMHACICIYVYKCITRPTVLRMFTPDGIVTPRALVGMAEPSWLNSRHCSHMNKPNRADMSALH